MGDDTLDVRPLPPSGVQPTGGVRLTDESVFAARLMEHLAIPAFVLDSHGRVMIWNKACERLTGCPACEFIGGADHWKAFYSRKRPCLADLVVAGRLAEATALYDASSNPDVNPHGLSAETWCSMPRSGHRMYLAIDVGPIFDEQGGLVAVVETLRDMTAKKRMEDELSALAHFDPLTSNPNRRAFDRRPADEWERSARSGAPLSLLLIDLDRFKRCNDSFGHAAGDRCLRRAAHAIQGEVRRGADFAARVGGDEFAAILSNTPLAAAVAIAERIRAAVESACLAAERSPSSARVTVSIGCASSRDAPSREGVFDAADAALYEAKRRGRNLTIACGDPPALDTRPISA